MKVIILAAGQGLRLRPLTNEKPKCMVEYNHKPIINYLLDTIRCCGIEDIAIVNGYKKEVLETYLKDESIHFFTNNNFLKTNMVSTLFAAREFMDDDIIISYADIIYKKEVLQKLMESKEDFSVVIDKKWKELWSIRMDEPLDDAETLKIKDGKIIELGKIPKSYADIEGQYIGLVKISKRVLDEFINYYFALDQSVLYEKKDFDNMYMTSLIQLVIDNLFDVIPVFINGGWLEIDSLEDLSKYKKSNLDLEINYE